MNKKVVFIADFFVEHVLGGGELNNEELVKILISKKYKVTKVQSHTVSKEWLTKHSNYFFIISNFVNLSRECREFLSTNLNYIIYEHDHKYLRTRNPASYKNFLSPESELINYYFYKDAKAILCQSEFHRNILYENLKLDNTVNLSGNLWSLETLEKIRTLSKNKKQKKCSIMNSNINHKNTRGACIYAKLKNIDYELIGSGNYYNFLEQLSKNNKFLFLPKTPETLSRVIVEARMLGCSVMTNDLVGASGEKWFSIKGEKLVDYMIQKREEILSIVEDFCNRSYERRDKPLVSIITTFHEAEKYLENFMTNIISQTMFDKCELIIIDAASPGREQETVEKYLNKYDNIVYKRLEEKLKITPCLNMALKMASGKYMTFAFVDDVKKKNCIELLLEYITKNSEASLVYGDVIETHTPNETFESNTSSGKLFEHSKLEFSKENMIKCLPGPMPLWDRDIHNVSGFLDEENCNYADDWDMWLRAVNNGLKFKKLSEIVGLYLSGGRSQNENNIEQRKEEAKIFFKYSHLFGNNFNNYAPYFKQFLGG